MLRSLCFQYIISFQIVHTLTAETIWQTSNIQGRLKQSHDDLVFFKKDNHVKVCNGRLEAAILFTLPLTQEGATRKQIFKTGNVVFINVQILDKQYFSCNK